ncbi:MAG: penicillin-binding protein 1C [Bacteroidales bacterium]|jgi:penicillin-binding protein 1C|nr:penicillin-binding protein 1C [Bacteroidales bacterium]
MGKLFERVVKKVRKLRTGSKIIITLFCAICVWFVFCLPSPLFQNDYATVLVDSQNRLLSASISSDEQWRFPESDTIPYKIREAVRYFEDEYFYYHPGINPVSLARALRQNISGGRVVSGGSTISMQVIRMACNHSSRSVLTKLYEMILALRLELKYSKKEILRIYVSHAPFGGNVVGIDAASWRYYKRDASLLSWGEACALAVLPNAPSLVHPGKNRERLLYKRNFLLHKLYAKEVIDSVSYELAKLEPLPDKPYAIPQYASHVLQRAKTDGYGGKRIRSTIQTPIQQFAEQTAQRYAEVYHQANHISNIAVLVTDTYSGEVLAYVGNVSLPHVDNDRFVDIISAPRSSGSILKPFLYTAMISDGELLPHQLVADIPTTISGYSPENFEKNYAGAVPASEALAHSLNIPAVRMLQQYGIEKFYHILEKLHFSTINRHPQEYGLSLILGGAEVSLWDVVTAYTYLGKSLMQHNRKVPGEQTGLQYIRQKSSNARSIPHSIFSPGAVYECLTTLSTLERPWAETGWRNFASSQKIAWKTGTSFGHRDAWSVGVTPEYTVGVWVGNASGEGRPGVTGLQYASPVLFEMFSFLNARTWFHRPNDDMVNIPICTKSGYRAQKYCTSKDMFVPQSCVSGTACPYHRKIFLDSSYRFRVQAHCYPVQHMKDTAWFVLPPIQEWFYKKRDATYTPLPELYSTCVSRNEEVIDVIVPQYNAEIVMPISADEYEAKIIFEAVYGKPSTTLFWHVDEEYVQATQYEHKIEYTPTVGKHILVIVDELGNTKKIPFSIVSSRNK